LRTSFLKIALRPIVRGGDVLAREAGKERVFVLSEANLQVEELLRVEGMRLCEGVVAMPGTAGSLFVALKARRESPLEACPNQKIPMPYSATHSEPMPVVHEPKRNSSGMQSEFE